MPFQISDSFHYAFKDLNYLIISAQKFRMLTVFLILSLNEKLCSSTDFPLFCLLVSVLAFEPNRAYKLNTTRLKLSVFSCIFLEVSVARISPNGFSMGSSPYAFHYWLFNISYTLIYKFCNLKQQKWQLPLHYVTKLALQKLRFKRETFSFLQ